MMQVGAHCKNIELYPGDGQAFDSLRGLLTSINNFEFTFSVNDPRINQGQLSCDFDERFEQVLLEQGASAYDLKLPPEIPQQLDFTFRFNGKTVAVEVEKANREKILRDILKAHMYLASGADYALIVLPRNYAHSGGIPDGKAVPVNRIRVIGHQFRFYDKTKSTHDLEVFDRQVRAFGADLQVLLRDLTIALVGCGGTGSAVVEQLQRLGVGTLLVYDGDSLEGTNVTRVYGSRASDDGTPKVEICKRNAEEIGLGTKVITYHSHIGDEATARSLRVADIILGCTDDHWGRSILCEISTRYLIPFIDMGVRITSKSGVIESICGRVTTVFPGAACLICMRLFLHPVVTPGKA